MKQLLVLLFLVSSMACFGQNKDALKDISSVTFYGIDFTRAKVYGAKEGPMQFKYTFCLLYTSLSDSLYLLFSDFLCLMDLLRTHRTDSDEFPADAGQLDYHCGVNGHAGY